MRKTRTRSAICTFVIASLMAPMFFRQAEAQVQTIFCPGPGFGEVVVPPVPGILPFVPLASLKTVPNPVLPKDPVTFLPGIREDLVPYIADLSAAIRLGKALFWDVQAGSDNRTVCASCHFHAGADSRAKLCFIKDQP